MSGAQWVQEKGGSEEKSDLISMLRSQKRPIVLRIWMHAGFRRISLVLAYLLSAPRCDPRQASWGLPGSIWASWGVKSKPARIFEGKLHF